MIKNSLYRSAGLLFITLATAHAFQVEPSIHVMIPKDMPMTIDFHRDKNEPQILKYVFTIRAKDALSNRITFALLDQSGSVKFKRSRDYKLSDPVTIAAADPTVTKIIVIAELLVTEKGKYVLDTESKELDILSLAKNGEKALPKAKFIPK